MAVIGQCRLCMRRNVELRDSHYLSKGIYRRLRDESAENPNPFLITRTKSLQTSFQLKKHLLCKICEERLSGGGEAWVLKHCLQADGGFPLRDLLAKAPADLQIAGVPTKIYLAAKVPGVRVADVAYFAASIFWRGTLYPWNDDGSVPIDLGPFRERFRRYLMGEEAFPSAATLWVALREGKGVEHLTYTPTQARVDGFHVCRFPMPGLAFMLIVSKNTPANHRSMCFAHTPGNPLLLTPTLEPLLLQEGVRMLEGQSTGAA